MPVEIIAAIIGGGAVITAAIIAAISKKPNNNDKFGSNSVSAGRDIKNSTIIQNGKHKK